MYPRFRRDGNDAARPAKHSRTLIALVSTAALIFGPGAMAAHADVLEPQTADQTVTAAATADPAAPPVTEPAAAPAALPVVAPVADPAAEAPPAEAPPAEVPAAETPAAETPPAQPPAAEAPSEDAPAEAPADGSEAEATGATDTSAVAQSSRMAAMSETAAPEPAELAAKGSSANPGNNPQICHAKGEGVGNWDNLYVTIPPNANGSLNGHEHHTGAIPLGDIIPPFDYWQGNKLQHFDGMNWNAEGQEIWGNDCSTTPPPAPGTPQISITPLACIPPSGSVQKYLTVAVTGITSGSYTLSITNGSSTSDIPATQNGLYALDLIPNFYGVYTVSISQGSQVFDSESTLIEQCAPVTPTVSFDQPECYATADAIPETVAISYSASSGLGGAPLYLKVAKAGFSNTRLIGSTAGTINMLISGVGTYTVSVFQGDTVYDSAELVIELCPPEPVEPTLVIDEPDCFIAGHDLPATIAVEVTAFSDIGDDQLQIKIQGTDFTSTVDVDAAGEVPVPIDGLGEYTLTLLQVMPCMTQGRYSLRSAVGPPHTSLLMYCLKLSRALFPAGSPAKLR